MSAFRVYPEQASVRLAGLRADEVAILARRHKVPLEPEPNRRSRAGRAAHILWKAVDRGYEREVRYKLKHRGRNLRWFPREDKNED